MSESQLLDVQNVVKSKENSLRNMTNEELMVLLPNEIQLIAVSYCGATLGDRLKDTAAECYEFLRTMYNHISFSEIKRAFLLTAAGKIEGDLSAYYGNFTVKLLGEVLGKYMIYRKRIEGALKQLEKEKEAAEAEKRKAEFYQTAAGRQKITEQWEAILKKYIAMKSLDMNKVSSKMYEYLEGCGKLVLTREEKWKYFGKAKVEYQAELVSEQQIVQAIKRVEIGQILVQLKRNLEENVPLNDDLHTRLAGYAKRLAVVDYVKSLKNF